MGEEEQRKRSEFDYYPTYYYSHMGGGIFLNTHRTVVVSILTPIYWVARLVTRG
jgi:hypothetical protein